MADDFLAAVQSGDLRTGLLALRDTLAKEINNAEDSKSVAPLAKQLADVMKAIDGLPSEEKSSLDELAERRARRRSQVQDRPPGGDVGGAGGR